MNDRGPWQIEELIGRALAGDMPGAISERLHGQLADLRTRLGTVEPAARAARAWSRAARWGLAFSLAAGALLAVMFTLSVRARNSFAEVAAAALEQPWIHVKTIQPDSPAIESWYSPSLAISAVRLRDSIELRDARLEVDYSYNLKEQILYRCPDFRNSENGDDSMISDIMALFQQERVVDKPLDSLDFLGREREQMQLLHQTMTKVTANGKPWLDYQMTLSRPDSADPMEMRFRVDATTKLPNLCQIKGTFAGKRLTIEARFDYPEHGPTTIYDLGVPKTAKFVDRIPTGDLKRILATLQAGRERMDDYRAVSVFISDSDDYFWLNGLPVIEYRKGYNFRTDHTTGWIGDEEARRQDPGKIDDLGSFWRERAKSFRFYPATVMRGATQYWSKTKYVTDADGSEHAEIVSVDRFENGNKPSELFPPDYSVRPEFACRPPMGIGDAHQRAELDPHPTEGPAGCILLRVGHTTDEGRINETGGVGLADENRFWLDPERDYIVMRWEMLVRDESGELQIHDSHTMEEVAQSPRGVWYASKIRRHCPETDKLNGERIDQIYHIYVDFDVDLPDSLFDPPKVGRIP